MNPKITRYRYNADECTVTESEMLPAGESANIGTHAMWINLVAANDALLQQAADVFHIHPLAVEDIAHPRQRAKMDSYDDMLYVVLRLFYNQNGVFVDQQLSLVLRNNVLLSFLENDTDVFKKPVVEKLMAGSGNLRKRGEDFLLYSILDVVIDNYSAVLEHLGDKIETLNTDLLRHPDERHLILLQSLKSRLLYIRKNMLPARGLLNDLMHLRVDYFEDDNKYFLRDLQDHMQRHVDELEFLNDQLLSLMDLYYSLQSHKMNNVMKTLTGVSFVLLPLTFIASLYGMNFSNIPRANSPSGFYEMVGIMAAIAIVLTIFAFRRNWLSIKDFNKEKE